MRTALGVHVSTYEVTASLVDTSLPELGPIASRTVAVAAAPGGIGGAVSSALGFMRVQAMQNDLAVVGGAIVCENALQREIVADALARTEDDPPPVVDIFDERLSDAFSPDVSAALLVGELAPRAVAVQARGEQRRGMWPIAAVGACVLAALGGVTAWAMTSQPAPVEEASTTVYSTSGAGAVKTTSAPTPIGATLPGVIPPSTTPGPEVVPDALPVDGAAVVQAEVFAPVDVAAPPAPSAPVAGGGGGGTNNPAPSAPTRTNNPSTPGGGGGGPIRPNPGSTTTTESSTATTSEVPATSPTPTTTSPATTTSADSTSESDGDDVVGDN